MARPYSELREKMDPERRARAAKKTKQLLLELELSEIRQAHNLTQVEVARSLEINQSAVSKIEHQTDILISTLAKYLESLGASLKVAAVFPEGEVEIKQFHDLTTVPE
jgi:DNA-binding XRE family transcriptional regulator